MQLKFIQKHIYQIDGNSGLEKNVYVLLRIEHGIEIKDDERYIHAKFQDTDFFIWIFKKNNLLSFSIGDFGIAWKKEFIHDHYGVNFARYIRLLLRVCIDFTILELKTSTI